MFLLNTSTGLDLPGGDSSGLILVAVTVLTTADLSLFGFVANFWRNSSLSSSLRFSSRFSWFCTSFSFNLASLRFSSLSLRSSSRFFFLSASSFRFCSSSICRWRSSSNSTSFLSTSFCCWIIWTNKKVKKCEHYEGGKKTFWKTNKVGQMIFVTSYKMYYCKSGNFCTLAIFDIFCLFLNLLFFQPSYIHLHTK